MDKDKTMQFLDQLRLPLLAAPMFLISGPKLVIACSEAGVLGSFPTQNARTSDILEQWLQSISARLGPLGRTDSKPWAVNLVTHPSYDRGAKDFELILKYRPSLVITALGSPRGFVEKVHDYGGQIYADVNSVALARKAAASGVDGLILVGAGSGGHTGELTGFAFVSEVRKFWDGPVALAGGICDGRGIRACKVLGAQMAVMGTRFIATRESQADDLYRQMLIDSTAEDLVVTSAFTGVKANMLKPSIQRAGYDLEQLNEKKQVNFSNPLSDTKAWKDIWSAGQGVGVIEKVQTVSDLVTELEQQYRIAKDLP